MSFRDIRNARVTRKPKSFVVPVEPSATPVTSDGGQIHQESLRPQSHANSVEQGTESVQEEANMVSVNHVRSELDATAVPVPPGCYAHLPPFLSIKRTRERGRGIWTNANIPAGT